MWSGKTYWLVGASEGLGRALAQELDRAGAKLVLSARSADRLAELAETLNQTPRIVPCDITDDENLTAAWQAVGDIDGMVFLAGTYDPMRADQWDPEKVLRICDINFTGGVRVLGHVVPSFTARGTGHIVIIGSLAGYRGLPGSIGYGSSKGGLMHLAESLDADLWHTKIKVQLINPGFIKTRLTDKNAFEMPFIMEADAAAQTVRKAMEKDRFQTDFPWVFSLFFRFGRFLPTGLYNHLFAKRPT